MSAALNQKPEIKIRLTAVSGPHAGQVFALSKASISIGRGPENDIVLINDAQVSRLHARIAIVDRDLEITNLSQKNAIYVQGEYVQKWKIVNNSNFTIGDTEFRAEYDLGQAIVSVAPKKSAQVVPLQPKAPQSTAVKKPAPRPIATQQQSAPTVRSQQVAPSPQAPKPYPVSRNVGPAGLGAGTAAHTKAGSSQKASLLANPKFKFYLIGIVIIGAIYINFMANEAKPSRPKRISSILKYEDSVNAQINSQAEKTKEMDLEAKSKERNTNQLARIEENFIKGMRDYQLGNYARAQEFFQLVLNLDPDHPLAKRHLYLCKVRFDEIVQEKLMLGESYFKKHNFRMCESLYRQVMDMLQGKNYDQKLFLAQKKAKECELADQGIR